MRACLCLLLAISPAARGQEYRTNIPAVTSARWTAPVPPLPPQTNITRAAYYSCIRGVFDIWEATYVPLIAGSSNEPRQASYAYHATFFYRATGDPVWYDLAMRCIRGDQAYLRAGGAANGLVLPARVAWLLHDTPRMQASTNDQQTLHDWLMQTEAKLGPFEVGAMNRAFGPAMLRECILRLWPSEPGNAERQAYVDQVWNDWHANGDLAENSAHYVGLSLRYLTWWLDIRGGSEYQEAAGMKKLAYRYLEYATPLGSLPHFGDGNGWNASPDSWMPVLERWGSAYQDGRFRWVAQRLFDWTTARIPDMWQWGNINYNLMEGLMDAWLSADDSVGPLPPGSTSVTTTRKAVRLCCPSEYAATGYSSQVTSNDRPDKLIFRDGWQPGDTYAVVELNPSGMGHGHNDAGGINAFVSQGSVLLHAPPYLVRNHQFHNGLIVNPLSPPSTNTYASWHFGACGRLTITLTATTNNPQTLAVSFDAKSLSGSRYLQINRPSGGGGSDVLEITPDWRHYEVRFAVGYDTPYLYFNPVQSLAGGVIVNGEFLLDNTRISRVTNGVLQNENLFTNPDFDAGIADWWGMDTRVVLARETADTAGGSQGALRVKADVHQYCAEETLDVRLAEFNQASNVGCARVEMRHYCGKDVDVTRRIFFLADKGLWVKDTVKAVADLDAEVGPGWNFTSLYGPRGTNWINACQVTVPVADIWNPWYLMQWSNRPTDTLVWFGSTAGAQMTTNNVTLDTTVYTNGIMNTTRWRVWQRLAQTLAAGSTQAFNSVLMPHAPTADATPLANGISLLKDTPDVSILRVIDSQTGKALIFGMNDNGTPQTIEPYGIRTDARWFKVVLSSASAVEDYWVPQGNSFLAHTGFDASSVTGRTPLSVTFYDRSIGTITNRTWAFGDGTWTNTTSTNVVHIYSNAGVYTVTLIVSGPMGVCTNSSEHSVAAYGYFANDIPYQMTFEPPGMQAGDALLVPWNTNGWYGKAGWSAIVTNSYAWPGADYPVPSAMHSNVLAFQDASLTNRFVPAGDGPRHAVVDLMSRNEFRNIEAPSTSSLAGAQASFFVDDAGHLNAWCSGDQNHTNRTWVTYTNTILSATNWSRLSVAFDYTSDQVDGLTYYRVAMNGVALPVPGGRGYACNRGRFARSPDGVWLVSANPAAKQVNSVALDGSGLLDDLVVQTNELAFLPFPQPIISTPRSTLFIVR